MSSLGPRSVERPADSGFTFVGCLDSESQPALDAGGSLQPPRVGWTIDWWIGGDDRWYLPSREPSTRQRRIGAGPVIETAIRIPSGDALHRAYGINSGGFEYTVIEIENDSPVPVALALAIRPHDLAGNASAASIRLSDEAIVIDGRPAVLLPKPPNELQASNEDLADPVQAGRVLDGTKSAFGPGANAVVLYPLTHKTTLRFVVPASPDAAASPHVPAADAVARGWDAIVGAGGKIQLPDPGLAAQADAARARLLGGSAALAERVADLEPGAGRHLYALALSGATRDVAMSMATLAPRFPPKLRTAPIDAASVIAAVGRGTMLVNDQVLLEAVLEPAAHITRLVERSGDKTATALALGGLARLAKAVGQDQAAVDLWTRVDTESLPNIPTDVGALAALAEAASASASWGPDEVDPAARFWIGLRSILLHEQHGAAGPSIDLLGSFPAAWRGGNFETLGLRTDFGTISFAIRWHGYRPALLWDVDANEPVTLRCPGLDPTWSTNEPKGETLLAGSETELPEAPDEGASFL